MNIEDKLDKIIEDINEIKVSQGEMKVDIAHHIKRSDGHEENLELLRKEFKPVKAHVTFINNGAKLVAGIAAILVFLASVGWLQPLMKLLVGS